MDKSGLRQYYDNNAAIYDRWMVTYDRVMLGDARRRLCRLARGRTLELAVGTGLNIPHYPGGVALVGLDYSPKMLRVAQRRSRESSTQVPLVVADASKLPFSDAVLDTVVTTLFLSSAPELTASVDEVWRVLKPDGRLLLLDHGKSHLVPIRVLERLGGRPLKARTGVDLSRDPAEYLPPDRYRIERSERSRFGIVDTVVARRL